MGGRRVKEEGKEGSVRNKAKGRRGQDGGLGRK